MGDIEVHEKFSILMDSKYTNFDMAMKVLLLAVCFFGCCLTVNLSCAVASLESQESRWAVCVRVREREREIERELSRA